MTVAKIAAGATTVCDIPASVPALSAAAPTSAPSRPSPQLPAFAPREDYVRLAFSGNPTTNVKLWWLSAVYEVFQFQQDRA